MRFQRHWPPTPWEILGIVIGVVGILATVLLTFVGTERLRGILQPTEISRESGDKVPTYNTWRGLVVAPECRCSPYERSDYRYLSDLEDAIVKRLGGMWSPYTGLQFNSLDESDIEHIISLSEAHDSGLCRADKKTRQRFSNDVDNLTLATSTLNRWDKGAKDASEWLPTHNRCWFAQTVLDVRMKYNLTIDIDEARVLDGILANCREVDFSISP